MKKRGLSTVVVAVLIIAFVIVALGIAWQIISGVLESSKQETEFLQSKINLKISSVFVDSSSVSVKVSRLVGPGKIDGLNFVFSDGMSSEIVKNFSSLDELEERSFLLVLTKLKYANLKTVSIAPTITLSSGEERIGNVLDTYVIKSGNYNNSFYNNSLGGGECTLDLDCPSEEEGSSECNLTGNVSTFWEVYSCVSGVCVSNQEIRLSEYCSNGCFVENATCRAPPQCVLKTDCGVDGRIGFLFCDELSGDVYENFIYYSCIGGTCSNEIVQQRKQDCEDWGCKMGEIEAECNPGLDCFNDLDCDVDGFISGSEYCVDREVWIDWKDNFCSNNYCINNVSQVSYENCSEIEGNWSCFRGECIEYVECTLDSHCNPEGSCGKRCINQTCVVEIPVNSGVVSSIWPLDMAEYFDSPSLPTEEVTYVNYFTKFVSGQEGRCLKVKEHVYPTPPGINAYLRFDVQSTAVKPGDNYQVWETKFNCECV